MLPGRAKFTKLVAVLQGLRHLQEIAGPVRVYSAIVSLSFNEENMSIALIKISSGKAITALPYASYRNYCFCCYLAPVRWGVGLIILIAHEYYGGYRSTWQPYCMTEGAQIPGARPLGQLNFVIWPRISVGPLYGSCYTSPSWSQKFWCSCWGFLETMWTPRTTSKGTWPKSPVLRVMKSRLCRRALKRRTPGLNEQYW